MGTTDSAPATPRKTPCASCPYRQNVPSGVWSEEEYVKLPRYDGDIPEQIVNGGTATFICHQQDGCVCSGWLGHRDPLDLLAVRLGLSDGRLHESCAEYTTAVPLFESGQAAAEHGMAEIEAPGPRAQSTINKLVSQSVWEKRDDASQSSTN